MNSSKFNCLLVLTFGLIVACVVSAPVSSSDLPLDINENTTIDHSEILEHTESNELSAEVNETATVTKSVEASANETLNLANELADAILDDTPDHHDHDNRDVHETTPESEHDSVDASGHELESTTASDESDETLQDEPEHGTSSPDNESVANRIADKQTAEAGSIAERAPSAASQATVTLTLALFLGVLALFVA